MDARFRRRAPWRTLWLFAFLALQPALTAALVAWGQLPDMRAFLAMQIPFWLAWIMLYPLVLRLQEHITSYAATLARVALQGIGGTLVITIHGVLFDLVRAPVSMALGRGWDLSRVVSLRQNAGLIFLSVLVYTLMGTYIAADRYRQRAMEERELAQVLRGQVTEARFRALRARLNPHFLFNALNALAMLIRDDRPRHAVRFLTGLSDLLRDAVDDSVPPEVPLRDELAFALKYLAVEQIRFDVPLRIDVDVADAVQDAYVPFMILQPLVENAIRHGIARREGAGTITIEARREGDDIRLAIRDNGGGLASAAPRKGTGLRNVEERLSELYGDAPRFRLSDIPGAFGAVASLAIPYRVSPAAEPAR